ncbi:FGGY family carbohydrate kinase [Granulicoccus sp. GXG6511]|uniref:FGGY family carbohydrate kinase n=1 Tax=Granulicoccus sp. GXG6511 TaxID=3381351 RepID=UPI003D7CB087
MAKHPAQRRGIAPRHLIPAPTDRTTFAVELADAQDPLIMALDVGSTATRGSLHDARGIPVRGFRHKIPHAFTTRADGTSTIDPDQIVDELARVLDVVTLHPGLVGRIAAVALDTFASSLVGVGRDGRATTPCFTYADRRSAPQLEQLRAEVDEAEVQQLTGARLHTSYLTPRFRWLRETHPEEVGRTAQWMSIGEYAELTWLGRTAAATSTAAWSGLLDRRTGDWSDRMLDLARVERSALSPIATPQEPHRGVPRLTNTRWPALADAAWFPPIADGLGANIGSGGSDQSTLVTSMATSGAMRVLLHQLPDKIPGGLWCYRIDDHRALLGGALNDVGRAVEWIGRALLLDADLATLADAPPTTGTPVVLPFFSGERSTGWAGGARAVLGDVTAASGGSALARGVLEGVVVAYARVAAQLVEAAESGWRDREQARVDRVVVAGRVSQDLPGLRQMLADCLGRPVLPATFKRSTLRGTTLLAAEVVAPGTRAADPPLEEPCAPHPDRRPHWAAATTRFNQLYQGAI